MKTIFLALSSSAETKNLLRTDFFTNLKASGVRMVLFVPKDKVTFNQQAFGGPDVLVEPIADLEHDSSTLRRFWKTLSYNSVPTRTIWIRSNKIFFDSPNLIQGLLLPMKKLVWILGHLKPWRSFIRFVEFNAFHEDIGVWKPWFDQYKPEAVFAANIIHGTHNALIKYARRRGVTSIGMTRGWDNLTSKGLILCHPDYLVLQNGVIAEEAQRINDIGEQAIRIVGWPQYDPYSRKEWELDRASFCALVGADPNKRILLYAMGGILNIDDPLEHVEMLDRAIQNGELPPATVLVRAHPKYDVSLKGIEKYTNVIFYQPGKKVSDAVGEWEFDDCDILVLTNTLRHSDIVFNTGSTLSIEAAIFDRPVILLGFDGYENKPYYQSVRHGLDVTHYRYIRETGATRTAHDEQEMIVLTNQYLLHPEMDHEGRQKLVSEQVHFSDGQSGERLAEAVIKILRGRPDSDTTNAYGAAA